MTTIRGHSMNPLDANRLHLTRRSLFGKSALGIGGAARERC
jgi:hypothetical protein